MWWLAGENMLIAFLNALPKSITDATAGDARQGMLVTLFVISVSYMVETCLAASGGTAAWHGMAGLCISDCLSSSAFCIGIVHRDGHIHT